MCNRTGDNTLINVRKLRVYVLHVTGQGHVMLSMTWLSHFIFLIPFGYNYLQNLNFTLEEETESECLHLTIKKTFYCHSKRS